MFDGPTDFESGDFSTQNDVYGTSTERMFAK